MSFNVTKLPQRAAVAAVAVLIVSAPLFGQSQQQTRDLGFSATGVYSTTDVDSVNLFNGNLVLTLPIGQSYPVSERLSYGLTLVHNSQVWAYVQELDPNQIDRWTSARAEPSANAGLGWMLSLGRLVGPGNSVDNDPLNDQGFWKYLEADGKTHFFFDALHPGETGSANIFYTRDGSYLRMHYIPGSPETREVHYPDGTKYIFEEFGDFWEVTEISNSFGEGSVTVDRTTDPNGWVITDSASPREHHIRFEPACDPQGQPCTDLVSPRVAEVEVATFDDTTELYEFEYEERFVERGCQDNAEDPIPNYPPTLRVPLLKRVNLPENEVLEMVDNPGPSETAAYFSGCGGAGDNDETGRLKHVVLPTGGRVEWDYDEYILPKQDAGHQSFPFMIKEAGVIERRKYEGDGTTLEGTWRYDNAPLPYSGWCSTCDPAVLPNETVTVVSEPTGDCTRHYFSAASNPPDATTWDWAYGLPFSHKTTPDGGGRFLSTEVWESTDPDPPNPASIWLNFDCTGDDLRSRHVAYDKDPHDISDGDDGNRNQRLIGQKTTYEQDDVGGTPRFAAADFSDFDGFGNFRTQTTSGNFAGENEKVSFTSYNASRGTYAPDDPPNHSHEQWDESERWILGSFSSSTVSQGGRTTGAEHCFEWAPGTDYPAQPFLRGTRRLESTTVSSPPVQGDRSTDDVLDFAIREADGNVNSRRTLGGDLQVLDINTEVCDFNTNSPVYRIERFFSHGVLSQEEYFGFDFNTYEATIDESTGRPSATKDTAGLSTTYTYDGLGRIKTILPVDEISTSIIYTPAANIGVPSFTEANVSVVRNGGAGLHTASEYDYDGFGRIVRERRLDSTESGFDERTTEYNARGWRTAVSEWGSTTDTTVFGEYDPFGRPETITAPDSKVTTLDYTGVSRVERTVEIELETGATDVTTGETYDRFGRLQQVQEPVTSMTLFDYTYDEANRLTSVLAGPAGGPAVQTRTFSYDGRGFLTSELHPEKGTVTYSDYDAGGHAGMMTDPGRTLGYTYDGAERLLSVVDDPDGTAELVKQFIYDNALNNGGGKLYQAIRHNRLDVPEDGMGDRDVVVTETYNYDGVQGRVSTRKTEQTWNDFDYSFGMTYDDLGRPSQISYPGCVDMTPPFECPPNESLIGAHEYGGDYLVGVGIPADTNAYAAISYHSNGLWSEIARAGPTATVQLADPAGMRRPSRIHVTGVGDGDPFDTGSYSYDGAGNVTAMDVDTFTYDTRSRLDIATVHGYVQDFDPDDYGNLTLVTTTPPGGSPDPESFPVNSATNRLNGAGINYDGSGNITLLDGVTYVHDPMNMTTLRNPDTDNAEWAAIYTADDERLAVWDTGKGEREQRWTLRSLSNQVLREFRYGPPQLGTLIFEDGFESGDTSEWSVTVGFTGETTSTTSPPSRLGTPVWSISNSYIYRGAALLADFRQGVIRNYHLDHLGSVRQLTDTEDGDVVRSHDYLPYGAEVPNVSSPALAFTGHERDSHSAGGDDDLDYMHGRYCSPVMGRFLSVDAARGEAFETQAWNRYSYVSNNPLKYIDPDGLLKIRATQTRFGPNFTVSFANSRAGIIAEFAGRRLPAKLLGRLGKLKSIPDLGDKADEFLRGPGVDTGGDLSERLGDASFEASVRDQFLVGLGSEADNAFEAEIAEAGTFTEGQVREIGRIVETTADRLFFTGKISSTERARLMTKYNVDRLIERALAAERKRKRPKDKAWWKK